MCRRSDLEPHVNLFFRFFPEFLDLLRAVLDGIAYFNDRIRVDRFVLHLTVAGYDPYNVALAYGKINAWLSGCVPLFKKLNARTSHVWTAVDFVDDWPHVEFAAPAPAR